MQVDVIIYRQIDSQKDVLKLKEDLAKFIPVGPRCISSKNYAQLHNIFNSKHDGDACIGLSKMTDFIL